MSISQNVGSIARYLLLQGKTEYMKTKARIETALRRFL
jgi:deoxyxylulose-5-phosphate synthase